MHLGWNDQEMSHKGATKSKETDGTQCTGLCKSHDKLDDFFKHTFPSLYPLKAQAEKKMLEDCKMDLITTIANLAARPPPGRGKAIVKDTLFGPRPSSPKRIPALPSDYFS